MESQIIPKKIVIVGGGFGGIRAALDLGKQHLPNTKIILISDKPHFEYHAALYRVVTGRSPLEVCIPLASIFKNTEVEVVEDEITHVDLKVKKLKGKSDSHYTYDYLVLALGGETAYFNIPGIQELSFGFKTIQEALLLKKHLHEIFSACSVSSDKEKDCATHIVIIGGGASGIELAGELAIYSKKLAKKHGIDPKFITIELIDANKRLLPFLDEEISHKVLQRLKKLGIKIDLETRIVKEAFESVYLKDAKMKTKTVIWTAGTTPNHLYEKIHGLTCDDRKHVLVDEYLQALRSFGDSQDKQAQGEPIENVFVVGDAAATEHSGMAQTADFDGAFVANVIKTKIKKEHAIEYVSPEPMYAIPVGPNWAVFVSKNIKTSGIVGWWMRRFADYQFFRSILSFGDAFLAFQSGKTLTEQCRICSSV